MLGPLDRRPLWEVVANGDSTVYLFILCGMKISRITILFGVCGDKLSRILDTGNNVSLRVLGYFTVSFRKKCSRLCPLKLLPLGYVATVKKNLNVHYSQLN